MSNDLYMNKKNPKTSVLLPVYNGEKYLEEAIESVLNQTFTDFELIIVNDGSADDSLEIINFYASRDSRIKVINNKKNRGFSPSLNIAIASAQGDYIARIDCDDIWCSKNKLEEQVGFLEKHSEYGLVGTSVILIDEKGNEIGCRRPALLDREIREYLLSANQFQHSSVLIRKSVLDEIGVYTEKKKYYILEDYDLWLRIGKEYKLTNLAGYYTKYRINKDGMCLSSEYKLKKSDLLLTFKYSKAYPHFFKSIMFKVFLFPFKHSFRSKLVDLAIFSWIRKKITGIKSMNESDDKH
jgi:glycosyltransferase involved in cell wall biosynthesis